MTAATTRTRTLEERVFEDLRRRLMNEEYSPGDRLPFVPELAAHYGVSATVIRDAVHRLSAMGLVDVRQGRGITVLEASDEPVSRGLVHLLGLSDATLGDVVRARTTLDLAVVPTAAAQRTAADVDAIRTAFDALRAAAEACDPRAAAAAHNAFHDAVLAAAGQPALTVLLTPLHRVVAITALPVDDADPWELDDHRAVLEAIASANTRRAVAAASRHGSFIERLQYAAFAATPFRDAWHLPHFEQLGLPIAD